ncbi:hypothetical protein ACIBH1_33730 [Nonomuraea sp. NPDC050663]|uniref:hypothetical protein n=1 Tax=Nonomuraea sp. NPDC050663 TaxID=3364370 RepID=UPI0037912E3F
MPVEMTRGPDASDFLLLAASELLGLGDDEVDLGLSGEAEESEESEPLDEVCEGDAAENLEGVDSVGVGLEVVDGVVGETATREPAVAMVVVDDVFTEAQAAVEAMARAAAPAAMAVQRRLPGASRFLREAVREAVAVREGFCDGVREGLRDGVREGLAECWPKGNHES